jgi:hypothetical protein
MATRSKQFTLNWRDLLKGFLIAAGTGGLVTLYEASQHGWDMFSDDTVRKATVSAIGAGIAYLIKNFGTNSDGGVIKPKQKLNNEDEPLGI